ncbi:hypothetical protein ACFOY8_14205 [Thalassospira xianhensis]|uniref:Uncharacterized protein n=1 Tax=Thalassospira xianhensis MCCC 1A02616 TaxID=1177929 RepID=A0A367UI42_9PROT|nr:hypothetical protein [Thalassospira xianhensis]RCK07691.1 hypothetical protein TH5_01060 [Thalassospira xianhensis MCCC 1A02616]
MAVSVTGKTSDLLQDISSLRTILPNIVGYHGASWNEFGGQISAIADGQSQELPAPVEITPETVAQRLPLKQSLAMFGHMRGILGDCEVLSRKISEYNDVARSFDPQLFADIQSVAATKQMSEGQAIRNVLDTSVTDPAFSSLRPRMADLADHPELSSARTRIVSISRRIANCAESVGQRLPVMETRTMEDATKIGAFLRERVYCKADNMPTVDVEHPSVMPGAVNINMKLAFNGLHEKLVSHIQNLAASTELAAKQTGPAPV